MLENPKGLAFINTKLQPNKISKIFKYGTMGNQQENRT
jgi:hypothetical protein